MLFETGDDSESSPNSLDQPITSEQDPATLPKFRLEEFIQFKRNLIHHLHSDTPDLSFYVNSIKSTLNDLHFIICIKMNHPPPCIEYPYKFSSKAIKAYNLSSLDDVASLEYHYYIPALHQWAQKRSLRDQQRLLKNFSTHSEYLSAIQYMIAQTKSQKEALTNAFEHLQNVIYIQDRHPKKQDLGTAYDLEKAKNYPLQTIQQMLYLKVDVIENDKSVPQQSLQEILWAAWCEEIQLLINEEMALYTVGTPNRYFQYYHDILHDALSRVRKIISIISQKDWDKAPQTKFTPFYLEEIKAYQLNSKADLLNLSVHIEGPSQKLKGPPEKLCYPSINSLLDQLKKNRMAACFYNSIYSKLLAEIFRLEELADEETGEKQLAIKTVIINLSDALHHLYGTIKKTYYSSDNNTNKKNASFLSVDDILAMQIPNMNHANDSLYTLIRNPYITTTLESELLQITFASALAESNQNQIFMYDSFKDKTKYPSIKRIKYLCALAEVGDLDHIKTLEPTKEDIDYIISCPLKSISLESYDEFLRSTTYNLLWIGNRIDLMYLGYYNALMVAVIRQHYTVVKYFLECKANPDIKGGRKSDYSARDCTNAACQYRFLPPPKPDIVALFNPPPQGNPVEKITFR